MISEIKQTQAIIDSSEDDKIYCKFFSALFNS